MFVYSILSGRNPNETSWVRNKSSDYYNRGGNAED